MAQVERLDHPGGGRGDGDPLGRDHVVPGALPLFPQRPCHGSGTEHSDPHDCLPSPVRVEYELTSLGRTLLGPIDAFGAWALEHGDEVMAAQERYAGDGRERLP
ncbi:hypothetical protein GCM10010236_61910 [Streptomyces eurythermus]|nr:hypothetical protein GCM10010236_61910 [Streptomyces eurythermus]